MLAQLAIQAAISAALGQLTHSNSKAGEVLKTLAPTLQEAISMVAQRAAQTTVADPVVQNQMNAEKPIQSRVVVGSSTALTGGVAMLLTQILTYYVPGYDWVAVLPAIPIVWGAGYALYGRLVSGLAPLFHRKPA